MNLDEDQDYEREGETRAITAPAAAAGERVDVWLTQAFADLSRLRVQGLIGASKLSVDGALVACAKIKCAPARYELILPPPEPAAPEPESIPLEIAFEDAHLLVVQQAIRHGGASRAGLDARHAGQCRARTLCGATFRHRRRRPPRHRASHRQRHHGACRRRQIGRGASGAREAVRQHDLERVYYAVTRGAPKERTGIIDNRLVRSGEDRRKFVVVRDAGERSGPPRHHVLDRRKLCQHQGEAAAVRRRRLIECRLRDRTHASNSRPPCASRRTANRRSALRQDARVVSKLKA